MFTVVIVVWSGDNFIPYKSEGVVPNGIGTTWQFLFVKPSGNTIDFTPAVSPKFKTLLLISFAKLFL